MTPHRPTWCEIDLSAVTDNIATLRDMVGPSVAIFACLKGDANGCGEAAVGRAAEAAGAAATAFGNLDRAAAARAAGLRRPILLYPSCLPDAAAFLERHDIMPTLSTLEDVAQWSAHARRLNVFLKLDGGGFRAGALPHHAVSVARAIVDSRTLHLAGVYGHPMTSYGPEDAAYSRAQIAACLGAIEAIAAARIHPPIRMVSSSEIILRHPEADLNAVDPGRLLLGHDFAAVDGRVRSWRPAMVALRSRLVMVKSLDEIGDVMPAPFLSRRPGMRIGLIPYGWTDGYPRRMPNDAAALVRGKRVRLLGPTHSELTRIDLTDVPDAALGDEVVLLGRSGDAEITIDDLAAQWQLSPPECYAAIGKSIRREYVAESLIVEVGSSGAASPSPASRERGPVAPATGG
jgi:alanine racemase